MRSGAGVHGFAHAVLRSRRRRLGLSRADVAVLIHTSAQAVAQWETGAAAPTPPHLKALAECLGIAGDDLIRTPRDQASLAGLRERAGLTARSVAERTNISRTVLSSVETGTAALTALIADRLAPLYETPVAELHAAWQRTVDERTRRLKAR